MKSKPYLIVIFSCLFFFGSLISLPAASLHKSAAKKDYSEKNTKLKLHKKSTAIKKAESQNNRQSNNKKQNKENSTLPVHGGSSYTLVSPKGYCCDHEKLSSLTEELCKIRRGVFYPEKKKIEAIKKCKKAEPKGFCCLPMKTIVRMTQSYCQRRYGTYYPPEDRLIAYNQCRSPELSVSAPAVSQTTNQEKPENHTHPLVPAKGKTQQHRPEIKNTFGTPGRNIVVQKQTVSKPAAVKEKPVTAVRKVIKNRPPGDIAEHVPGQILVSLDASYQKDTVINTLKRQHHLKLIRVFTLASLRQQVALFQTRDNVIKVMELLNQTPGVVSTQVNGVFTTMGEPMSGLQNISKAIDIDHLHRSYSGKNMRVAIVDTGVDLTHKELQQRIIFSQNYFRDSTYQAEIHGTAVAGIIGASTNNYGIRGVAPDAKLLALRGCRQLSNTSPEGQCYSSTIAQALDTAIIKEANVVSLSLGSATDDRMISALLEAGAQRNIIFVAPAGNSVKQRKLAFPASHKDVVAVAGYNEKGEVLPNNLVGAMANVKAPARHILTTIPGNRFNFMNGTSLSSAMVSGLLALAREKAGSLDPNQLYCDSKEVGEYSNQFFKTVSGSANH